VAPATRGLPSSHRVLEHWARVCQFYSYRCVIRCQPAVIRALGRAEERHATPGRPIVIVSVIIIIIFVTVIRPVRALLGMSRDIVRRTHARIYIYYMCVCVSVSWRYVDNAGHTQRHRRALRTGKYTQVTMKTARGQGGASITAKKVGAISQLSVRKRRFMRPSDLGWSPIRFSVFLFDRLAEENVNLFVQVLLLKFYLRISHGCNTHHSRWSIYMNISICSMETNWDGNKTNMIR